MNSFRWMSMGQTCILFRFLHSWAGLRRKVAGHMQRSARGNLSTKAESRIGEQEEIQLHSRLPESQFVRADKSIFIYRVDELLTWPDNLHESCYETLLQIYRHG